MQILEIALYSHNGEKKSIPLKVGEVNIITGNSGTGKTALIEIVDYCLGRSSCNVPDGPVRSKVSWFGLTLQFPTTQMFIARQVPPIGRDTTNRAYYLEGAEVNSPPDIGSANTTSQAIEDHINSRLGISPNVHTPPEGQSRPPLSANFRHALFFSFQQQDEIATKRTLFHRQSEVGTVLAIKDTLPYFLGAIREDALALELQIKSKTRDLRIAQRALQDVEQTVGIGTTKGIALASEAIEAGILDLGEEKLPESVEGIAEILNRTTEWIPAQITVPNSSRLISLQDKKREVEEALRAKSDAIHAAETYEYLSEGYSSSATQQELRLESLNLYDSASQDADLCPTCSHPLENSIPTVEAMRNSLQTLQQSLARVDRDRPKLREYIEELIGEKETLRQQLTNIIENIEGIYQQQDEVQRIREENYARHKTVGRISMWLESVNATDETLEDRNRVVELQGEIEAIQKLLDPEARAERLNSILYRVGVQIMTWAQSLDLEHANDNLVRFDLNRGTIIIETPERSIPLFRIGSGENWLGYHLVVHLALHKYFVQQNRPTPRFLFLDQPTQVYYPSDITEQVKESGSLDKLKDTDRIAVNRLFNFVFQVVNELAPEFQVIITDHANLPDEQFQHAIIDNWRDGNALIPNEWPNIEDLQNE